MNYVFGEKWKSKGNPEDAICNLSKTYAKEFRYDNPRARYLDRDLNLASAQVDEYLTDPSSGRWSDYDGDSIYGDWRIDFNSGQLIDTFSFEPGMARVTNPGDTSHWVDYFHSDILGTTKGSTRSSGETTLAESYTAFGERVCSLSGPCPTVNSQDRYGYVGAFGYEAHTEFPFLHVGARYYDPASGRFLQRDPIGIDGGFNGYEYVFSCPTIYIDPSGNGIFGDVYRGVGNAIDAVSDTVDGAFNWGWSKLPTGFHAAVGAGGQIPILDPGSAQNWTLGIANVASIAAPVGVAISGGRWLKNARGIEVTINRNWRVGWHRLPPGNYPGAGRNLPHYHHRITGTNGATIPGGGIGRHRPWQGSGG